MIYTMESNMQDVAVLSSLTVRNTRIRMGQHPYDGSICSENMTLIKTPLRRYWVVCASPFSREAMRTFIPQCDAVVILYDKNDFLSGIQARQWETDEHNDIPIHYTLI